MLLLIAITITSLVIRVKQICMLVTHSACVWITGVLAFIMEQKVNRFEIVVVTYARYFQPQLHRKTRNATLKELQTTQKSLSFQ